MKASFGILTVIAGITAMGVLFSMLNSCGPTRPPSPIDGARCYAHVQAMVEMGPRPAGSDALKKNCDYIVAELAKHGIKAVVDSWQQPELAPKITFRNVHVDIPGTRKGETRMLILGSHYDTKDADVPDSPDREMHFVGANDAASSSGLLIEIAAYLKANPLACPVRLYWFDGEESLAWNWDDKRALFGSRRARDQLSKQFKGRLGRNSVAMVLLDMVGAKDLKIIKDTQSSPQLIEIFAKEAAALNATENFFQTPQGVTDDHIPFKERGVPVIDIIQFGGGGGADGGDISPWWHTHDDDMDIISAESMALVGHVVVNGLPKVVEAFCK